MKIRSAPSGSQRSEQFRPQLSKSTPGPIPERNQAPEAAGAVPLRWCCLRRSRKGSLWDKERMHTAAHGFSASEARFGWESAASESSGE
jgi:hypothetical protein